MQFKSLFIGAVAALGLALASPVLADNKSSKSSESSKSSSSTTVLTTSSSTTVYTSGAATLNHPGRLLASNCFQCHGTNGHGMESLAGKSAGDITGDLFEMRQKPAANNIMNVHAQGYTSAQVNLIADYFSKQQK
jgi:sulfide dehydrogenase cytochrome subunit